MERLTRSLTRLRSSQPWLDRTLRTLSHYGAVNGNAQAGAVTFFGFLSIFPLLAVAFSVVGRLSRFYPELRAQIAQEIDQLLPGVIGTGDGQISLRTIEDYSSTVGFVGLLVLLYSGLGWLSATRSALEEVFAVPAQEQPNMVLGKLRDLRTLALVGVTLLVSVVLSGAVTGFSGSILDRLGVDPRATGPALLLNLVGHVLAIGASTVLLLAMFVLLVTESQIPRRSILGGALLGAIGFEVLKLAANLLLGQTRGQPAFQVFGVTLILLVWIDYFSRLVMFAAAWAYTAPAALAVRIAQATRAPGAALAPAHSDRGGDHDGRRRGAGGRADGKPRPWVIAAVAATAGALAALAIRGARR
jgi:membrane protein